jgi:hypothetical protein
MKIMYHPTSQLLLAFVSWRFSGLAFVPAATKWCRRRPLKLEFNDFDLSVGSSSLDLEGKSTNGANLNANLNLHGRDFPVPI